MKTKIALLAAMGTAAVLVLSGCSLISHSEGTTKASSSALHEEKNEVASSFQLLLASVYEADGDYASEVADSYGKPQDWSPQDIAAVNSGLLSEIPELAMVDTESLDEKAVAQTYFTIYGYQFQKAVLSIPDRAIQVKGDNATLDLTKVWARTADTGEAGNLSQLIYEKKLTLVKRDNEWLFVASSFTD
jgi:hypothetical protein